jgi:hypothetical protein
MSNKLADNINKTKLSTLSLEEKVKKIDKGTPDIIYNENETGQQYDNITSHLFGSRV